MRIPFEICPSGCASTTLYKLSMYQYQKALLGKSQARSSHPGILRGFHQIHTGSDLSAVGELHIKLLRQSMILQALFFLKACLNAACLMGSCIPLLSEMFIETADPYAFKIQERNWKLSYFLSSDQTHHSYFRPNDAMTPGCLNGRSKTTMETPDNMRNLQWE